MRADKKEMVFQDRDYLYYFLGCLRDLEKQYCLMITYVNNNYNYQIYRDFLLTISRFRKKIYSILFMNGWYLLNKVEEDELRNKYRLFFEQYGSKSGDFDFFSEVCYNTKSFGEENKYEDY